MAKSENTFTCIKTEGAILPSDQLSKIASGHTDIDGLKETDFFLVEGEKLSEAISRSWARLIPLWEIFNKELVKLPENDPAIGLTRSKWLLPLFQELGYGQLQRSNVTVIEGKEYPISHFHDHTPIHLVGSGLSIDKRSKGVAGAARISPHGLIQEFLNRSEDYLWAFVSNGLYLRILRDNVSLTRQAYVEFDLKAIMDGQVYSDFSLLWLLCHASRVTVPDGKTPEDCWLEKWSKNAIQQGTRVMEDLRVGVEKAIACLGSGFLACRTNNALRDKLRAGQLDKQDYYRQLLRIVYRLIFLFVAEDRDLLILPDTAKETKEIYLKYYSTRRLRNLAQKHKGTQHCDLWQSLRLIFAKLHKQGCPELGLPALGSFLWNPQFTQDLEDCNLTNRDFLEAVRSLAYTIDNSSLRQIDYKNLGSEELGSVYESLLELHPQLHIQTAGFELKAAAGHERKTTGSYYTPTCLINCLLDSALNPVIDAAAKKENPEKAILDLKVCDPACGSGHFLVAAAHRIAKRLASVRGGEEEPSPEDTRKALRDVISHCIYGVDINPMSVELCKISLWLEAIEPGKPLSFLDHHIKCGNSLLGTTPALMEKGIPDEAFNPIEGDIKAICSDWKKQNKDERKGQDTMFSLFDDGREYPWDKLGSLSTAYNQIEEFSDDSITSQEEKQKRYEDFVKSSSYKFGHLLADAWCSAFVIEKSKKFSYGITEKTYREIERNPHSLASWLQDEIIRLATQYQFFHWHLEFPSVFNVPGKNGKPENEQTGLSGGFDCVLGNPPWERIKLQEKEWFAERKPAIAEASNAAARKRMIEELKESDPTLFNAFKEDCRKAEGESHLVRDTGYFPLCGRGDVNTYSIFAELKRNLINSAGKVGCIVPSGLATDDTTKLFFADMINNSSLVSFYEFENEGFFVGAGQGHMVRFALTTIAKKHSESTQYMFQGRDIVELYDKDRVFSLSKNDIHLLNPNTHTCPIFRHKKDVELTKYLYRRFPVLVNENDPQKGNPWNVSFLRMFDMANDSHKFLTKEQLEERGLIATGNIYNGKDELGRYETFLPLYEAKMVYHYNHRYGDFSSTKSMKRMHVLPQVSVDNLKNPYYFAMPYYWVQESEIKKALSSSWNFQWFLGWRDATDARASMRTMVASIIPFSAVNHKFQLVLCSAYVPELYSQLLSMPFDYLSRQKLSGLSFSYFILKQLPAILPEQYISTCVFDNCNWSQWLLPRIVELTYTAWDLKAFAKDSGYDGPPFIWDEERRFIIRVELDAAYFHLYLGTEEDWKKTSTKELLEYFPTPRHAVDYIMETFPIVKKKDEKQYGSYRTKELILEVYDKMAEAIRTGQAYQSILDPIPGPPCDAQGNFVPMSQWNTANWPIHIHQPKEATIRSEVQIKSAEQIAYAMAILDVLALLHTWNKPTDRRVFELGMLLMQKDGLRARVLNKQTGSKTSQPNGQPHFINFDEFLGELSGTNSIVVETHGDKHFISLGTNAPDKARIKNDVRGKNALEKAQETVKAVEKLKETDYTLDIYCGVEDYGPIEFALS